MTDVDDPSPRSADRTRRRAAPLATALVAPHPERVRVRALDDGALIMAMRAGDDWAWSEFVARARPVLEGYAARVRDPDGTTCVDELLTDVALHLATPGAPVPTRLAPYLLRAALRCRRHVARDRGRRAAWHASAAHDDLGLALPDGAGVVGSVVSMHSRRAAAGDCVAEAPPNATPAARAIAWLVERLAGELRGTDLQVLTWHADGVPHRQIAAWLDLSYDAVAKRVQRLGRRLAARVPVLAAALPPDERAALDRLLRRVPDDGG